MPVPPALISSRGYKLVINLPRSCVIWRGTGLAHCVLTTRLVISAKTRQQRLPHRWERQLFCAKGVLSKPEAQCSPYGRFATPKLRWRLECLPASWYQCLISAPILIVQPFFTACGTADCSHFRSASSRGEMQDCVLDQSPEATNITGCATNAPRR